MLGSSASRPLARCKAAISDVSPVRTQKRMIDRVTPRSNSRSVLCAGPIASASAPSSVIPLAGTARNREWWSASTRRWTFPAASTNSNIRVPGGGRSRRLPPDVRRIRRSSNLDLGDRGVAGNELGDRAVDANAPIDVRLPCKIDQRSHEDLSGPRQQPKAQTQNDLATGKVGPNTGLLYRRKRAPAGKLVRVAGTPKAPACRVV
jgi:hypothetical protein